MYTLFNCRGKTITLSKNEIQRNSHVYESVMEKSVQLKDSTKSDWELNTRVQLKLDSIDFEASNRG